jgi:hypothetical protein
MIMIDVETDMESEFTFHRPYRQGEKEFWETSAYYNIIGLLFHYITSF